MSLAVHHLAVKVSDLDRAEHFYREILRLPLIRRWDDAQGRPRSIWLSLGAEAFLAVERGEGGLSCRQDAAPGWHCIALRITAGEREEWKRRFEDAGVPLDHQTAYTLYFRDPDGNVVALSHHPDVMPEDDSASASRS